MTRNKILFKIETYKQLIFIFEAQKDLQALESSKAKLLTYENLLKQCK